MRGGFDSRRPHQFLSSVLNAIRPSRGAALVDGRLRGDVIDNRSRLCDVGRVMFREVRGLSPEMFGVPIV